MARFRWAALVVAGALLAPVLPACSRTAAIDEVFTALDSGGERRRVRFTTDSKGVFCIVSFSISRPGATLEVTIRQTQLANGEGTDKVLVAVEDSPSRAKNLQSSAVQFTGVDDKTGLPLDAEKAPIPAGTYRCEARIDGELGGLTEFRVDYADCPVGIIPEDTANAAAVCKGFYEPNKRCPKYGATSKVNRTCTCAVEGLWRCDQ